VLPPVGSAERFERSRTGPVVARTDGGGTDGWLWSPAPGWSSGAAAQGVLTS
jgi:hypothetical protein